MTAEVARAAVAAQRRGAQRRWAVVDEAGYLLLAGVTRRRPHRPTPTPGPAPAPVRGGIVELHLPAALLTELAADPAASGQSAGVVADLAAQYTRRKQLLAALDNKPAARFARGPLARHIQIRDRNCCHPGCARPAIAAELDHTRDHAAGGPTTRANIDPNCGRHHWYKSALGWRLRQPEPGTYEWTSPLGQVYRTRGEPVRPDLPQPDARRTQAGPATRLRLLVPGRTHPPQTLHTPQTPTTPTTRRRPPAASEHAVDQRRDPARQPAPLQSIGAGPTA